MNTKKELLELAGEEEILAICIGAKGLGDYPPTPQFYKGKKKVEAALEILDFNFDDGYGGESGYSLYAWTESKVIVKGTYDGSEWYESVPRNPSGEQMPDSIGGG